MKKITIIEANQKEESTLRFAAYARVSTDDEKNGVIDLPHLAVTTLSYYQLTINPGSWNGWAGDLVSAYSLVRNFKNKYKDCNLNIIARAYIGGEYPEKDLPYEPINDKNRCNYTDLCSDGYAILLASYLKKHNGKLDSAFRETFINNKGRQFAAILSDIGAKKDVSEIKNKVTSVVNKVLVKWLTIFENEFTDSPEEVKEACIETFSKWLYLSI